MICNSDYLEKIVKKETLLEIKGVNDLSAIYYLIYREKAQTKYFYITISTDGPAMGAAVADVQGI